MTPRPSARTRECTPSEARTRREQSRAFIDVADLVLSEPASDENAHVAAALAVLAAIAASDAICGLKLGRYSRGQDHAQAVALLETVELGDKSLPNQLRRVLASKDIAHYSPKLMSQSDARVLVRRARAIVDAASL